MLTWELSDQQYVTLCHGLLLDYWKYVFKNYLSIFKNKSGIIIFLTTGNYY